MRRLLPHPLLTLCLAGMWLMLNDTLDIAHLLMGLALGLLGGAMYARLEPSTVAPPQRLAGPGLRLVLSVLGDIVQSNLAVLRIVLGVSRKSRIAGFLPIPLQLKDPRGLALLAVIVTATPGTSWAHHDASSNVLTLHVLDLRDEEALVRQFKDRYERRLMEIFG